MDSDIKTEIYKEIDVTYNGKIIAKLDLTNISRHWISVVVIRQDPIEDSHVCDCEVNYGGICLKYRTVSCNGKEEDA